MAGQTRFLHSALAARREKKILTEGLLKNGPLAVGSARPTNHPPKPLILIERCPQVGLLEASWGASPASKAMEFDWKALRNQASEIFSGVGPAPRTMDFD